MTNKLAPWSWILPVIGISTGLSMFVFLFSWNPGKAGTIFLYISFITLVIILPLLGLIFGIITLVKIKRNKKSIGKGHAIAGIILSSLILSYSLNNIIMGLIAKYYNI
jgi:hypothetical protein